MRVLGAVGRRERILRWSVALLWTAMALAYAFASSSLARTPLDYKIALIGAGVTAGLVLGFLIGFAARRQSGAGAFAGHLLVVPPALHMALLGAEMAGRSVAKVLPTFWLPAYVVLFSLSLILVAALGALLGAVAEAAIGSALRVALARFGVARAIPWRAVRVGVLMAVLIGSSVYAAERAGLIQRAIDAPLASPWIEEEKTLFGAALAAARYEVLVLPVQAGGPSFDRIARSLMTRYLAHGLAERSGASVADPTLVARALDVRAREIPSAAWQRLAGALGARSVLESRVRRSAATFRIEIITWQPDAQGGWQQGGRIETAELSFGDRLPPEAAMRASLGAILDALGFAARAEAAGPGIPQGRADIDDLRAFVASPGTTPEERALRLQLIGALHERESLEAQELWERSLVALRRAEPSLLGSLLEARAYLHLSRRPYALQALGQLATPAAVALRAALDGQVDVLERSIGAIDDPALKLMAELELADLYDAFGLKTRLIERRRNLASAAGSLGVVLRFRLAAPEWFSAGTHEEIAAQLGLRGGSVKVLDAILPWAYWAYGLTDPLGGSALRTAIEVEEAGRSIWRSRGLAWAQAPSADGVAERDYYDLLVALNRAALLKTVRSVLFNQALPESALQIIRALEDSFGGHPALTYYEAAALEQIGRRQPAGREEPYFSRATALALATYRWEGGESHLSAAAEGNMFGREYARYDDEPVRWYRKRDVPHAREQFDRIRFTPEEMARYAAMASRQLQYADRSNAPLREATRWLRRAGRLDEAHALARENAHRFVGSSERVALLDEIEQARRSGQDLLPMYDQLLDLDPESWETRRMVAQAHMERGDAKRAQQVYLAYPLFATRPANDVVRLSNIAYDAGDYFHRAGEPALAMPLFIVSARMGTGSAREMRSREKLALNGNDMLSAMQIAQGEVARYNNSGAAMRVVLYQALLGREREAQASLAQGLHRFDDETMWTAAFILHRMLGLEGAAAEQWLVEAARASGRSSYFNAALRERHAFMLAYIDREPAAEADRHLRRVVSANNGSWFYPAIAEGYAALRARDYAAAAQKLRRPFDDQFSISVTRQQPLVDILPYVVLAYSRAGQREEADRLLEAYAAQIGIDGDFLIAQALLQGADGNHEGAARALRRAFLRLAPLATRTFFSGYVLLEACEVLLDQSGQESYRQLIEDFARRLQVSLPHPWAAAYEAKYARDLDRRQLAIAAASTLDPKSPKLAPVAQAERDALKRAVARHDSLLGVASRTRPTN